MANKKKYKTGDIVRLKSGGPSMTVEEITGMLQDHLECHWFAGDKLNFGIFHLDAVEPDEEPNSRGGLTKPRKDS
jgi:uncharacterized protein YodC (DUF2158 family)